jgi:3-phenylpropionate/trans-cinnamate dioxygenase ferredoxin reductase subunit
MQKTFRVSVNGEEFSAYRGDLLLDAALMNGVAIPHDCRSGHCGTCRVRLLEGRVFGPAAGDPDSVQACQSRIISDLQIAIEDVPEVTTTCGRVTALARLAPDIFEVAIRSAQPIYYLPGQYLQLRFSGFPVRCYSPTFLLYGVDDVETLRFHVRVLPSGQVSSALGARIRPGHRVHLIGPFGSAYLRPDLANRLILIASGTGFAPTWSIARAALHENPCRAVVLIVGARSMQSLYMVPALRWLAHYPNVTIIPVVSTEPSSNVVRVGRPTDYIPILAKDDIIYTCGAPSMVETVSKMAFRAEARCYADAMAAYFHRR